VGFEVRGKGQDLTLLLITVELFCLVTDLKQKSACFEGLQSGFLNYAIGEGF
jgi:hypothetical protein